MKLKGEAVKLDISTPGF